MPAIAAIDFGFDPARSPHHFAVLSLGSMTVQFVERFAYGKRREDEAAVPREVLKAELDGERWQRIREEAADVFNAHLRAAGFRTGAWRKGGPTLLAPHLGGGGPGSLPAARRPLELARVRAGGALVAVQHHQRQQPPPRPRRPWLAQGDQDCAGGEPGEYRRLPGGVACPRPMASGPEGRAGGHPAIPAGPRRLAARAPAPNRAERMSLP